jgi:hypothetical protein
LENAAQCVREAQQFQIFPRKTFGLARKALGNPSKFFDVSRIGGDGNFRKAGIIKALACIFLPWRSLSLLVGSSGRAAAARIAWIARLDGARPTTRQGCGEKAGMSRKCFCKIEWPPVSGDYQSATPRQSRATAPRYHRRARVKATRCAGGFAGLDRSARR